MSGHWPCRFRSFDGEAVSFESRGYGVSSIPICPAERRCPDLPRSDPSHLPSPAGHSVTLRARSKQGEQVMKQGMKKQAAMALGAATMIASPAMARDRDDWTGFYIGAQAAGS